MTLSPISLAGPVPLLRDTRNGHRGSRVHSIVSTVGLAEELAAAVVTARGEGQG